MQESLTNRNSQSTPRPDELRDGTEFFLHEGRPDLYNLEEARRREEAARQAIRERQRPIMMHEQIGVIGEKLDHFRLWEQELAADAIEDFALWEHEFTTANEFAYWEETTPPQQLQTGNQDDFGLAA